jgi:ubiquinone/menaquinone biosynthesis C-methylase UbiE
MNPSSNPRYVPALAHDWLTPYYDAVVRATTREQTFKRALIHQARIEPGQHVLDLACGTGTLAIMVKQREPLATVIGVDGDRSILAIAGRKAEDAGVAVQFDYGLSDSLPYPDGHFDRALSTLFFHHLTWADKRRAAGELFRVLGPGAELHVADWGRPANAVMRALFVAIQVLDGFENTEDNAAGRLVELFQWAGFSAVAQPETFNTVFGTLALYSARKRA